MANQVKVTVDASGTPSCNPNELDVGKSNGAVVIKWTVNTAGWKITNLTDDSGNPLKSTVFSSSQKNGNTGWKITDKNDDEERYDYQITVKSTTTNQEEVYDPVIRNGGQN